MIETNLLKPLTTMLLISGLALGLAACAKMNSGEMAAEPAADGEIAVPAGYRSWTKFVPAIDKPNGQVREIYINDTGLQAKKGDAFPAGTVTVMELYAPKKDGSGNPIKDGEGRVIRDRLDKVFVMAKGDGWRDRLPGGVVANGDWLYGAYLADGTTPATRDFTACRACHAPLAIQDFIHRYDEHFAQK